MKILVAIKRVIDAYVKIRIKPDQSGVETNNVKMAINPFDEIAVEEAIRLKEKGIANEVVVVSIGPNPCQETLRSALALGADRAIHVETEQVLEPLSVAKLLHKIVQEEQPKVVVLGKQSIDGDHNQTGQMLAALLDWPQGTNAYRMEVSSESVSVTREIDGGLETVVLDLPAVVTTDLRLNQPRFATLPNIMNAKKKPLDKKTPEMLGVDISPRLTTLKVSPPPPRKPGIRVHSVAELVDKLRHEAKVIK